MSEITIFYNRQLNLFCCYNCQKSTSGWVLRIERIVLTLMLCHSKVKLKNEQNSLPWEIIILFLFCPFLHVYACFNYINIHSSSIEDLWFEINLLESIFCRIFSGQLFFQFFVLVLPVWGETRNEENRNSWAMAKKSSIFWLNLCLSCQSTKKFIKSKM